MRRLVMLAALVFVAGSRVTGAQVVQELTPEAVSAAIAAGSAAKADPGTYMLGVEVGFSTPFSRIASRAFHARKEYKTFTAEDAPGEEVVPQAWLAALPQEDDVAAIAIVPRGSRDPGQAVAAIREFPQDHVYRTPATRRLRKGRGLVVIYPVAAVSEDSEIVVVYAGGREVRRPFKLKGVR